MTEIVLRDNPGELYDDLPMAQRNTNLWVPSDAGDSFENPGVIQSIFTWAKQCPDGGLVTHVQEGQEHDADSQFRFFLGHEYGRALAFTLRSPAGEVIRPLFTAEGNRLEYDLDLFLRTDRTSISGEPRWKGNLGTILIDNYVTDGNPDGTYINLARKFFENGGSEANNLKRYHFTNLLLDTVLNSMPDAKRWLTNESDWDEQKKELEEKLGDKLVPLNEIMWELFDNAERWGRWDTFPESADTYNINSIRGIRTKFHHPLNRHQQLELAGLHLPYLESLQAEDRGLTENLYEISIFDNGPGLASRRLREDLPADQISTIDEYNAVQECLLYGSTEGGKGAHGMGLYKAMKGLNELDCLLILRTGHLSLYRDFKNDGFDKDYLPDSDLVTEALNPMLSLWALDNPELAEGLRTIKDRSREAFHLRDSVTGSKDSPSNLPYAAGNLFTFLVPVRNVYD